MKNAEVVTLVRETMAEVLTVALKEQDARFDQKLKEEFGLHEARFDQRLDDLKENIRDEMRSCISASETRMTNRMDGALERVKTEIIDAIGEILDESVLPQISDLQADMRRVKNHLQMA